MYSIEQREHISATLIENQREEIIRLTSLLHGMGAVVEHLKQELLLLKAQNNTLQTVDKRLEKQIYVMELWANGDIRPPNYLVPLSRLSKTSNNPKNRPFRNEMKNWLIVRGFAYLDTRNRLRASADMNIVLEALEEDYQDKNILIGET